MHAGSPNPTDFEVWFQAACYLVAALVAVAILMMVQVSRAVSCRHCPHCKTEAQRAADDRARKRHTAYHAYTDRAPSACSNPECPGRKQ